MALKQGAFNFDFTDDTPPQKEEVQVVSTQVKVDDAIEVVQTEPIDVDIYIPPKVRKKSTRGRMKISDMEAGVELINIPEDEILFQKSYYSMGEVVKMFNVNPSLIRYWENEFKILKPKKNGKGDRFFRPEDVKNLRLIYHLLRERKYTIEGAKAFLKQSSKAEVQFKTIESLKKLRQFLLELKNTL